MAEFKTVAQLSDIIGNDIDVPTVSVKADTQNLDAYETYLETLE